MKPPKRQGAVAALITIAIAGCNASQPSTLGVSGAGTIPPDDVILETALAEVEAQDLCDGFFQPEAAAESRVYPLGDNRALVEVVCAFTAYQMVYTYGVYEAEGGWRSISLDLFYPSETGEFVRTSEGTVGGLADFDPAQGRLTVFSKARGIGDCGSLADYRWTGDNLDLETYRYQECSESPNDIPEELIDPTHYPQIFP